MQICCGGNSGIQGFTCLNVCKCLVRAPLGYTYLTNVQCRQIVIGFGPVNIPVKPCHLVKVPHGYTDLLTGIIGPNPSGPPSRPEQGAAAMQ